MWKPPQRIKFHSSFGHVPTREQAAASRLFSPVRIGPVGLEQRTWVPAMVPWRSNEDGAATVDVLQWYERFARGRPGALVIEATGIRDVPSGPLLRISHDRYIDGLRGLVGISGIAESRCSGKLAGFRSDKRVRSGKRGGGCDNSSRIKVGHSILGRSKRGGCVGLRQ